MKNIVDYIKIIKRYIILSFRNLIAFPFEFAMRFMHLFISIGFIFVFWISIFNTGIAFSDWNVYGIILLSGVNMLSKAISSITFRFRDLEYYIIDGSFDKYLMRPINPFFSMLMESLNIFSIVSNTIISIIVIIFVSKVGNVQLYNIGYGLISLIFGTLGFELLYGSFSLLAFWFGKIYSARELIFSFRKANSYPMDIFPKNFLNIFTYIIPLAFLSTIPTKILLGKIENTIYFTAIAFVLFILNLLLFNIISKFALAKYNSTGS